MHMYGRGISFLLDKYEEVEQLDHMIDMCLNLKKNNCNTVFQGVLHSHQQYVGIPTPPHPFLSRVNLFKDILIGV